MMPPRYEVRFHLEIVDALFRIDQDDSGTFRAVRGSNSQQNILHENRFATASGSSDQGVGSMEPSWREVEKIAIVFSYADH